MRRNVIFVLCLLFIGAWQMNPATDFLSAQNEDNCVLTDIESYRNAIAASQAGRIEAAVGYYKKFMILNGRALECSENSQYLEAYDSIISYLLMNSGNKCTFKLETSCKPDTPGLAVGGTFDDPDLDNEENRPSWWGETLQDLKEIQYQDLLDLCQPLDGIYGNNVSSSVLDRNILEGAFVEPYLSPSGVIQRNETYDFLKTVIPSYVPPPPPTFPLLDEDSIFSGDIQIGNFAPSPRQASDLCGQIDFDNNDDDLRYYVMTLVLTSTVSLELSNSNEETILPVPSSEGQPFEITE